MREARKIWKIYIGGCCFALYGIATIAFFIVPFLGFPGTKKIVLMTIISVLGEVFFLLSLFLLGKTIIKKVKETFWQWFKKPAAAAPFYIGKSRHRLGVWLFFMSFVPYPLIEISLLFSYPAAGEHTAYLLMLVAGDILFVISLFVLGEPFWEKMKRLFEWNGRISEDVPS